MKVWFRGARANSRGRLLSEFMVSLGLFFLILTADLTILNSASASTSQAANTQEALSLARQGVEELIASSNLSKPIQRTQGVASKRSGEAVSQDFQRITRVVPLDGSLKGLSQAVVTVEWDNGRKSVRLERYVASL